MDFSRWYRRGLRWMMILVMILVLPLMLVWSGVQTPEDLTIDGPNVAVAATTQPQTKYRIDAGQSRFMVKADAGGLLSAFAHDHNIAIRDFSGTIDLTPETIVPASLQITINSGSLAVTDKVSESDRQKIEKTMREEVLEVAKFPEIVFKSSRIDLNKTGEGRYTAKIWGDLTLHGVTRNGLIQANVTLIENGVRATGGFPLKQSDYNIRRVSVAGGTIRVKDELKLSFNIVARS